MKKHRKVIIVLIVIISMLLVGALIYSVVIKHGADPSETLPGETTLTETEFNPDETITVPKLEGNSALSEDRQGLLDQNILKQIERITVGTPVADEDGNYIADENGELIYEAQSIINYINYEENLIVIINEFADAGYSNDTIAQVQRFYFEYADVLAKYYDSDKMIEKLKECFRKSGNTTNSLTSSAKEIFGFIRGDDFVFVFEPTVEVADIKIPFCVVKINTHPELTTDLEKLCIYDDWYDPFYKDYERNLEDYLHIIILGFEMAGYNNHEIVLAQLLYAGTLTAADYRSDFLEVMMRCIPKDKLYSIEELRTSVINEFNVDIMNNLIISNYFEGKSEYGGEIEN